MNTPTTCTAELDRVSALVAALSDAAAEMPAERLRAMTTDERRLFDCLNVKAEDARTRGDTAAWLLLSLHALAVRTAATISTREVVPRAKKCERPSCKRPRFPGFTHCCRCCSHDAGHSRGCVQP